jgi:hypothetical protein
MMTMMTMMTMMMAMLHLIPTCNLIYHSTIT